MVTKEEEGVLAKDGPLYRLAMLAPMVEVRADVNPALRKAARVYLEQEKGRDGPPTWGVLRNFCDAWNKTPLAEKKRVLNGWLPRDPMPKAQEVLRWTHHSPIIGVLRVACEAEGQVEIYPDYEADDGMLDCVTLTVKEGTDGATVIAALRAMTAALEVHWEKAIELAPREGISVPADESWRCNSAPVELALEGVAKALAGVQAAIGKGSAVAAAISPKGPLEKAVERITGMGNEEPMGEEAAGKILGKLEVWVAARLRVRAVKSRKKPQTGLSHTSKLGSKSVKKATAAA